MSENRLPHEIMVEILCRLPSKSLLRCRSVCKSWHSLIADPSFISLHRCHSPSFLLLGQPESKLIHCFLNRDDAVLTLSNYSLPLPSSFDLASDFDGGFCHCHGLLCLSGDKECSSLIICNPSLRRSVSLPKPFSYPVWHLFSFAFGFDSRHRDYKIVRLANSREKYRLSAPSVEVFSLASGIWRTLPADAAPVCAIEGPWLNCNAPHNFVNGLVHWGASRSVETDRYDYDSRTWRMGTNYSLVLSFDFVEEVFHEVLLPESLRVGGWIEVVGSCDEKPLTVYHWNFSAGSIWVMKEYGVVESWNKVFHFDVNGFCVEAPSFGMKITGLAILPPRPLCITNDGEILLLTMVKEGEDWRKKRLYSLDVERKTFVDIQLERVGLKVRNVCARYYAESLVLLNNIDGMVPY